MKRLFSSSSPFKPSPATMIVSYILLLFWTFLVLFPIYWLFVTAFKLPIDVNTGPKYLMNVDFQPSTHAWREMFEESGDLVTRPYKNTVIVGLASAVLALVLGSGASYALSRFTYRPKPGLILAFVVCAVFVIVMINQDIPWQVAVAVGIGIFLLILAHLAADAATGRGSCPDLYPFSEFRPAQYLHVFDRDLYRRQSAARHLADA
jgi:multiple sugar transport system permease protein